MKKTNHLSFKAFAALTALCASLLFGIWIGDSELFTESDSVTVCSGGPGSVWDNY